MGDDLLLISERNMPQASFQAQQTCTSAGHYGYGSHAHDFVELMSGVSHKFADLQLRVDTTWENLLLAFNAIHATCSTGNKCCSDL